MGLNFDGSVDGGGGGGFFKGLIRRKQVDSSHTKSSSSSSSSSSSADGSDFRNLRPQLAKSLTVPHLIAIGSIFG